MRTKKALLNTLAGLGYEAVALICGMILPRLILSTFGSGYNGITNSITQFLSCIALLRAGIGGVTRAALYKPLAAGDNLAYSRILRATEIFMRRLALIFLGFLAVFALVFPAFVRQEFDFLFTASLVMILGISTFVQYYYGFTYQMLLNADQREWVSSAVQIFTTILNTLVACLLLKLGCGIHLVKLGSAAVFALNPLFINFYAHKKYRIVRGVEPDNQAVAQRWDAFAHQAANFVNTNTDIMILTAFRSQKEVSVYSVYYLVFGGLTRLFRNSVPGVAAAFGDMMARGEKELLEKNFRVFELVVYSLAGILFITCGIMIVPFVMLYTKNVVDVNYSRPLFAALVTIASFFGCTRIPYQHVVEAAGHYRQTKKGAFFEAAMNITISVIAVFRLGLVGVALGTLAAAVFRTTQYAVYLDRHIIPRKHRLFLGHTAVSGVIALLSVGLYSRMPHMEMTGFLGWTVNAACACALVTGLTVVMNLLLYRQDSVLLVKKLAGLMKKRSKQ